MIRDKLRLAHEWKRVTGELPIVIGENIYEYFGRPVEIVEGDVFDLALTVIDMAKRPGSTRPS